MPEPLETDSYKVNDPYFGQPYIDVDEQRDAPYPHRHVHGGFADCDARFAFSFPDRSEWQGRMYMPLEGAHAGNEEAFGGPLVGLRTGLVAADGETVLLPPLLITKANAGTVTPEG